MNLIFACLIFITLNFNIDINELRIGLIPNFVGYIIMYKGLNQLDWVSERYVRIRPAVLVMTAVSAVFYAVELFGVTFGVSEHILLACAIALTLVSIFISYNTVMGLLELERSRHVELSAEVLYKVWRVETVLSLVAYVLFVSPELATLGLLASLVAQLCFLICFNTTRKQFNALYH